ncbi:MAG: ribonuclease H family protein, partial [Agrobacterium sp.]|uniref:ribonuclease H family protein n=1 Tax=Agrobacterium sp. TaxID=361 RepID=UPI0040383290
MAITEWATIAYTDGSCIKTSGAAPASVGAGVYIPENNVLITAALNDPESKTINRAELTAIHAALKAGAKRIATDSLCSLYQIRRALANPMSLITHRHNDILTAIATLIIDSPATIHFYKVRAHSGIIGNEGADALAKHAALHPELANTPAYRPTTRKETNTWLNNEADGDTPAPLPDCRQSVRAHMHRKHSLGLANQDSIYYQLSQEITKAAAKGAGERVMTDTNISILAQRTALLYRTGGLYNQKLAMRWKRATDDRCPLCGEADSATHLLSGCSETLPMVQERHNGAGRLIAKAISKGTLGGYISFADTGSWEKGAREDLDLPNDTLHT